MLLHPAVVLNSKPGSSFHRRGLQPFDMQARADTLAARQDALALPTPATHAALIHLNSEDTFVLFSLDDTVVV